VKAERPCVVANFALTADGKISTRNRTPSRFTSAVDKARLQEIRAGADAVMVGRGTLVVDRMSLGLSREDLRERRLDEGRTEAPLRVIVSNRGLLDPRAKVFRTGHVVPVVFSTTRMEEAVRRRLAPLCDLHLFEAGTVSLPAALAILRRDYGVRTLVCEGGSELFRSLVELGVVDEMRITLAPLIFGGMRAPTLTGLPGDFLLRQADFRVVSIESEGGECFLHLRRSSALG